MKSFYVYLIESDLGFHYIGQTANLDDRLHRHNSNRSKYTSNKGKWNLIVAVQMSSRSEAVRLETKLKNFKDFNKAVGFATELVQSIPT